MALLKFPCCVALVILFAIDASHCRYQPTWDSLDTHPVPRWYEDAKIGVFIHWGVFSVPSYGSEWFWYLWEGSKRPDVVRFMLENYKPTFTYQEFAPMFTTEFFNPEQWAELLRLSGAKYVVLTSKHHEGYTLWPSKYSPNWNSMDVGPHRDLVGELAAAVRATAPDVHFGLYHSLFEWFNPLYLDDRAHGTRRFVLEKTMPELYELVLGYKPEIVWSDGDWLDSDSYWNSTGFLAWLYNDSPVKDTVLSNDRWGMGIRNKHGDVWTGQDRYDPGKLIEHKWENCMTIDRYSWGYRRNAQLQDYLTIEELLAELAETISCNGNILINVGPTKDGVIAPVFEERLRQLGSWLNVNGEAVYATRPWKAQNDTVTHGVWYTASADGRKVYALVLKWPKGNKLILGDVNLTKGSRVFMLGYDRELQYETGTAGIVVTFPELTPESLPCKWAWALKFEGTV
ncbi:alpha-L-fucosidase-like [Ornithodoros turicata]|uniref:alpha-L-fucosidase-like n=1 Tax=Ornithodoros turicata TaxID=34597 RepID=UPI0031391134